METLSSNAPHNSEDVIKPSVASVVPSAAISSNSNYHSSTKQVSQTSLPASKSTGIKRKKGILMKDVNAPKAPLSAYLIFLSKTRESVRLQNPGLSVVDQTRLLGTMWSELSLNEKQVFIDQAENDKKQYVLALEQYHKSESYKKFIAEREKAIEDLKQKDKDSAGNNLICLPCYQWFENSHNFKEHVKSRKHQRNVLEAQTGKKMKKPTESDNVVKIQRSDNKDESNADHIKTFPDMSDLTETELNISVFSDVFLHYNRNRESKLRKLRRSTTEYEEQNAILSKHIDTLNSAIEKFEKEERECDLHIKTLTPFLKKFINSLREKLLKGNAVNSELNEWNIEEFTKACYSQEHSDKLKELLEELNYPACLNEVVE